MYRFRITDVVYTRHLIDSVGVTDSLITNIDFQRIKILCALRRMAIRMTAVLRMFHFRCFGNYEVA